MDKSHSFEQSAQAPIGAACYQLIRNRISRHRDLVSANRAILSSATCPSRGNGDGQKDGQGNQPVRLFA